VPETSLAYKWYGDGVEIVDATHADYTPVGGDVGRKLTVAVTGSAIQHMSVTKTSAPSAPVTWPLVTGATPTLSTTKPVVGKVVTATAGAWLPSNTARSYKWYRDSTVISGPTPVNTYTPVVADLGHSLKVAVTGSAPQHSDVTMLSAATALVSSGSFVPTVPVLSTTRPAVDQMVTANTGTWGTGNVKFAYQWYRVKSKSKAIAGATGAAYRAVAKDVGYKLKVKVTGTVPGVGTATLYSKVTSKVKKGTFVLTTPLSITGTAKVGQTLTFRGAWSGTPTLKYQWYRGSKAIKKAKAQTYLLTAADLNKVMKVKVTATRSGFNTVVKTVKLATKIGPAV
jgi:hypothetical protein